MQNDSRRMSTPTNAASAVRAALLKDPDVLVIGHDRPRLSRCRARRLAYQYRGSRRGQWYQRYLSGESQGLIVGERRLYRMPPVGQLQIITTLHSETVVDVVRRLGTQIGSATTVVAAEDPVSGFAADRK